MITTNRYGATEVNPLTDKERELYSEVSYNEALYWTSKLLKRIVRFRVLSDRGFPMYDVSYCYGERIDGKIVPVRLPFHQLTKARWKTELFEYAKAEGVHAKNLGFFDPMIFSTVI